MSKKTEELANKHDSERSRFRRLTGLPKLFEFIVLAAIPVLGISYIMGLHYEVSITLYQEQWVGLLLSLYFIAVFLAFPARPTAQSETSVPWHDWVLVALGCLPGGYLALYYPDIAFSFGSTPFERPLLAALTVLLLVEAMRRTVGWSLAGVLLVGITYGLTANYFPGILRGQPVSPTRLMDYIYTDPSAIIGMLGIGATYGLAFVAFGQVLLVFGAGQAMTNLALLAFGRFRGGGSKAAIAGSTLAGTISGAPMANVLLTGSITIPLMQRSGYSAKTAGAIEAVASSGGQVLPPVMGIAAFLIAENLGIPFAQVALAALLPAVIFYLVLFLSSDLAARKNGIQRLPEAEMPKAAPTFRVAWVLLPTFGLLLYTLFILRLDPSYAAASSSLFALPIMLLIRTNRTALITKLLLLLRSTGLVLLDLAGVLVVAGIVVGVMSVTGLSFQFAHGIIGLAQGNIVLLMLLGAVAAIILGMGMPSVAAYALVAVLLVPGMVEGGIPPLAAHLFVFYFAVASNITPPIAIASFAASTISGASPMGTAIESMKVGWMFFAMPFLFVLYPALLFQSDPATVALTLGKVAIGAAFMTVAIYGYLRRPMGIASRALLGLAGAGLLIPAHLFAIGNIAGVAVGSSLIAWQFSRPRQLEAATDTHHQTS
ncbi:MAG: TRAP transporter fused permease subunit [Pelagibacterium sp.]|uniref:TRAP transporter permease n=1 Tax=Pelagibacterium sp. TaxID=1967288 RepID=UPI0032EDEEB4